MDIFIYYLNYYKTSLNKSYKINVISITNKYYKKK